MNNRYYLFIILIQFILIISCEKSAKIDLTGEWTGIDTVDGDSISVALMIGRTAEYSKGLTTTFYGNWEIDTLESGKQFVNLNLVNPSDPEEDLYYKQMEIFYINSDNIRLRMDNQTMLKRHCHPPKRPLYTNLFYGDIEKIVYKQQDIPVLYYQNLKIIITAHATLVIITNQAGKTTVIDQTYPTDLNKIKKSADGLSFFQIDSDVNQLKNHRLDGIRKEVTYYNNCGRLFRGWSLFDGSKVYGNISPFIDSLAEEIKSFVPENADIFERAKQTLDSLKYLTYYNDKYLTKSMYKILGMLSEYRGVLSLYTGDPRPNHVQGFYKNEGELAEYFEKCMLDYKNECPIEFKYQKLISDGYVRFESKRLSKIINAYYKKVDRITTLNDTIFFKVPEEYKLNYIMSTYKRFGDKNRISMSNAGLKIQTLGKLLKELGCTNVISYYVPSVPTLFRVFFTPNALVKSRLQIKKILTQKDIVPELEAQKEWEKELGKKTDYPYYF